jgi:hypothetical protein
VIARTTLSALLAVASFAPAAAAQDKGVFVDPDSPAGKEYAIPLDQARRDAGAGGNTGRDSGTGGQPLFGVGIERAEGASKRWGGGSASARVGGPTTGERRPNGGGRANGARAHQGSGAGGSDNGVAAPRAAALESTAGSDKLPTAGIASAVLGAGLLVGFGLRRLLRGS